MVGASGWRDPALAPGLPGLRARWRCRHLDQRERSLLPACTYDILDSSSFCRAKSPALSHPQRRISCGIGAAALAGSRATAGARRLAGSGNVGIASGAGTIRRVDHRNEEHPVGLLLSACYFLLFAITRSQAKWNLLLADNLLFRRRDHEQTIDRNADEGAGG